MRNRITPPAKFPAGAVILCCAMQAAEDWGRVLEGLIEGDRLALAKLTRLVASFLARWNAYDFHDEWDDLIQEVLLAAATALRDGKIRDRRAVVAYLKSTARFKFADRLKAHLRRAEDDHLPWEDVVGELAESSADGWDPGASSDLLAALENLPDERRRAVIAVYLEGCTYDEAAAATGIPLGSLKRYLRDGLADLREALDAGGESEPEPVGAEGGGQEEEGQEEEEAKGGPL